MFSSLNYTKLLLNPPIIMLLSTIIKEINHLSHIQKMLPTHGQFIPERQKWIKTALTNGLPGMLEFFETQKDLDEQEESLVLEKRAASDHLTRLVRSYTYLGKGICYFHQKDDLVKELEYDRNLLKRAEKLHTWVSANETTLADVSQINDSNLAIAIKVYRDAKAAILDIHQKIDASKEEFLKKEDEIDDLYHEVTNALEGIFHEDREIMLVFMPWKERKTHKTTADQTENTQEPQN